MFTRNLKHVTLFDAQDSAASSSAIDVRDYRHVAVMVTATANASLTFKFQGSLKFGAAPTLSSAQAVANPWDYVACYDMEDPSSVIDGDTGVTLNNDTVANNTRIYVINTDLLQWFGMTITAYTDGEFTAWMVGAKD